MTVDRLVGDEVEEGLDVVLGSAGTELEDLTVTFADEGPAGIALCVGSAGTELEDLTVAFADEDHVGYALCAGSGIVWQEKLELMVDLTEGS